MGTPAHHAEALARLQLMTLIPPRQVAAMYEEAKREVIEIEHIPATVLPLATRVFHRALEKCIVEEKRHPEFVKPTGQQ